MPNVFISYRRSDTTAGYASWIYERLEAAFGAGHVFMDVDSLPLGIDFVEHLERPLSTTDVALVLIGPGWLEAADETGARRLDDPDDFVRIEVAAALRASLRVIPVLVDGAQMPKSRLLPDDLRALARRQALTFQRHGGAAIRDLEAAIEQAEREGEAAAKAHAEREAAAEAQAEREAAANAQAEREEQAAQRKRAFTPRAAVAPLQQQPIAGEEPTAEGVGDPQVAVTPSPSPEGLSTRGGPRLDAARAVIAALGLVAVVVMVLVLSGAFSSAAHHTTTAPVASTATRTSTTTTTPPNPTTKTYANAQVGISFAYPAIWQPLGNSTSDTVAAFGTGPGGTLTEANNTGCQLLFYRGAGPASSSQQARIAFVRQLSA